MVTTLTETAKILDIPAEHLTTKVKMGIVSSRKAGRIHLMDPEVARKELDDYGFFRRREMLRKAKERKAS